MYFMRSLNRLILLCIASTGLLLSACSIDEDLAKPKLSPDFILPLVYGELDLKNLVKDTSFIKTDPSGYLKIGFLDTLEVLNAEALGDALKIVQVAAPAPPKVLTFPNSGGSDVFPTEADLDVNLIMSLSKVKTLALHSAQIKIIVQNAKAFDFNGLDIKIPGLLVNGTEFTTGPLNITSGQTFEQVFPIGESIWDLTGKPGGAMDTSMVYFQFNSASPIQGPAGGSAGITIQFMEVSVKYWQGKSTILQQVLSNQTSTSTTSQLVPAETYKGIKSGSISLKDVDVKLNFQSRMGIPLGMRLVLETTNGVTGQKVAMTPLDVNISQSTLTGNAPIYQDNPAVINESTSNLADVLTNFPTTIKVTAGVGSTFNNPDPLAYFFHENSDLKLFVDATIPFAVSFNQLKLESIKPFELFQSLNIDTSIAVLDTGIFYFTITNGFPYDINIDLNALNGATDSVAKLASIVMVGATTGIVNGEEKVISPSKSTFEVALSQNLFEKLKTVKNLGIKAKINTTANSPKIYTDYKLGFDVKARVKVTATPIK